MDVEVRPDVSGLARKTAAGSPLELTNVVRMSRLVTLIVKCEPGRLTMTKNLVKNIASELKKKGVSPTPNVSYWYALRINNVSVKVIFSVTTLFDMFNTRWSRTHSKVSLMILVGLILAFHQSTCPSSQKIGMLGGSIASSCSPDPKYERV